MDCKITNGGKGQRDHIFQMFAYCTVLGLTRGHLVYAEGHAKPTQYVVQGAGIEIVCHSLDLDQDLARLLGQIRQLADQVKPPDP